jgi:2-hydroxy-3-oxopropionate reductase
MKKEKIGFIGLGIMGRPMAENLIKAGYDLIAYDVNRASMEPLLAEGAAGAGSIKEVAEKSGVIITMLPNSPHVKAVMFGKDGVLESTKSGAIVIDMSSIAPLVSREVGEEAKKRGIAFLDAPVSGGEPKAINKTLAIMVGGEAEVFEKAKELLFVMGSSVTYVGEIGSGNTVKLANQIIVALNIAAMSEAMVLSVKSGVDPVKVYEAIRGGLAGSTVLDAKMPMVLDGNFKPGFRIELHIKDLANALETAHEVGAPLPLTSQMMEILQALKVDGLEKNDHSAVIRFYEKLAGVEVRKEK